MDAFEQLIATLFRRMGYWIRADFRVELDRGNRPQIDLLAYRPKENLLRICECKSWMESAGVTFRHFERPDAKDDRLWLFNDDRRRENVLAHLTQQLVDADLCLPDPKIKLCLACGHIANETDRAKISSHFESKGWILFDENQICDELAKAAGKRKYEDDLAVIVAKLLIKSNRH